MDASSSSSSSSSSFQPASPYMKHGNPAAVHGADSVHCATTTAGLRALNSSSSSSSGALAIQRPADRVMMHREARSRDLAISRSRDLPISFSLSSQQASKSMTSTLLRSHASPPTHQKRSCQYNAHPYTHTYSLTHSPRCCHARLPHALTQICGMDGWMDGWMHPGRTDDPWDGCMDGWRSGRIPDECTPDRCVEHGT